MDHALAEQHDGWSATTVAIGPNVAAAETSIVGYFTLSPLSLRCDVHVQRGLGLTQVYPHVGGYLLGRLGVAGMWQGRGLGPLLVQRAIASACAARASSGGLFLAVDAKNERLLAWYLGLDFGFVRLSAERMRLVMRLPEPACGDLP